MIARHPGISPSAWSFIEALAVNPLVDAVILFGSRAVGDEDKRSDVDLAVCGAGISHVEWAKICLQAEEAQTLYKFTLVHFEYNPNELRRRILTTGVMVYDRLKAA